MIGNYPEILFVCVGEGGSHQAAANYPDVVAGLNDVGGFALQEMSLMNVPFLQHVATEHIFVLGFYFYSKAKERYESNFFL